MNVPALRGFGWVCRPRREGNAPPASNARRHGIPAARARASAIPAAGSPGRLCTDTARILACSSNRNSFTMSPASRHLIIANGHNSSVALCLAQELGEALRRLRRMKLLTLFACRELCREEIGDHMERVAAALDGFLWRITLLWPWHAQLMRRHRQLGRTWQ